MSLEQLGNGLELRVARSKETQRATFEGTDATPSATAGATPSLKAAASAALGRNRACNATATDSGNGRNSTPRKHPLGLRSTAPSGGGHRDDATSATFPSETAPLPAAARERASLTRGRKLLKRLRWTGRHVLIGPYGRVDIVPRLGTADRFGQDVAEYLADIAAALADEGAS